MLVSVCVFPFFNSVINIVYTQQHWCTFLWTQEFFGVDKDTCPLWKLEVVGEVVEVKIWKPRGHQTKYITSTATYNNAKLCTQEFPLCHCFALTQFMISASCITFTIFYQHTTCKRNGMENNIPTHLKWVYFCSWRPNALVDLTTQRFQMGSDISDMDQDHWHCLPNVDIQDHKT